MAGRIDLLEAYVETYLTQEIRAEALVRSLESLTRFLEVAALANAQVTNTTSLARDAAVARPTVQGYFEVLTDTLLETLVFHELRAQIACGDIGGELAYYRTPSGTEIDFIWTRGKVAVGIEVQASERWRPEFSRALKDLHDAGVIRRAFGVYPGDRPLRDGAVCVLPLSAFLRELADGRVLAAAR